jgi:sugar/nucleoside kinase (ribokinase family)
MTARLLVVGSVALDSVETPAGSRTDILGGSATFFSVAASLFAPVSLVAVVGEDFPEEHLQFLRSRNVDLAGLVRKPGRTFRWRGRYAGSLNEAETLETQLNVFETFSPKIPEAYRDIPYVFLGNIHPTLQHDVCEQVRKPKLVAADTHALWITKTPTDLRRMLGRVDLVFLNDGEARLLSGEHNLVRAARVVQSLGPRRVVIKRGDAGVMLIDDQKIFTMASVPVSEVRDPTGAGDSFAGGVLGEIARTDDLSHEALRRAIVMGTTLGSLVIESFSIDRMRELTMDEVKARRDFLYNCAGLPPTS